MEQPRHPKTDISSAICELNSLNRNSAMSSSLASSIHIGVPLTHGTTENNMRSISMVQHRQPIADVPLSDSFSDVLSNHPNAKIQMSLNPRYISKITNTTRKIVDTSLRMRPYFIPERSRTKSENSIERDNCSNIYPCTSNNFLASINSNSNTSMMETCEGYVIMDAAANSTSNSSNTSVTGFNGLNSFNNGPINSAAQIFNANARTKCVTVQQLKKSKSLEDIRAENIDGSQPSHEMEFVSSRIQKLKVHE